MLKQLFRKEIKGLGDFWRPHRVVQGFAPSAPALRGNHLEGFVRSIPFPALGQTEKHVNGPAV